MYEVHFPTDTLARLRMLEELCSRRVRVQMEFREERRKQEAAAERDGDLTLS